MEQKIKQALENYQAEYNPADWKDLENRLDKIRGGNSSVYGLSIAAIIIILAGLIYYFYKPNEHIYNQNYDKIGKTQTIIPSDKNTIPVDINNSADKEPVISHSSPDKTNNSSQKQKTSASDKSTGEKSDVSKNPPAEEIKKVNGTSVANQEQSDALSRDVIVRCNKNTVCAGEEIMFYSENILASDNYRWDFGDGKSSSEKSPAHIYKKAGTYKVLLRIISSADKKSEEYPLKEMLKVYSLPEAGIQWFPADENELAVNFEAVGGTLSAKDGTEWQWDFGDKQNSTEQKPLHVYSKKGNYAVMLTVKNSFGCTASCSRNVKIEPAINLFAPTGFSPNGDGINDTWIPVALLEGDKNFTLMIFDVSGKTVYQTSDKNLPWDGTNTKPGETYFWKVMLKDKTAGELFFRGMITVTE